MTSKELKTINDNSQKASLRGEAPKKHSKKSNKQRKQNPKSVAARAALIGMGKEAKSLLQLAESGLSFKGFEKCRRINDVLVVMHQQASGCAKFQSFLDWKEEGYKVKKGATGYGVWGTPRKAKNAAQCDTATNESSSEVNSEESYEYWPICYLYNESQVEKLDSNNTEREESNTDSVDTQGISDVTHFVQDMGNNESLTRGLFPESDGEFLAMTFTESKRFKTKEGAIKWLEARGLSPDGQRFEDNTTTQTELSNDSPFVTVDYEEQQENRRDRMVNRAAAAQEESLATYSRAKDMASVIPFGQPILVGHHSEKRDRRYREKIHNTFGKAFNLQDKADHYSRKAESVGCGGIASNDPEAIEKLKTKLEGLEKSQEIMKGVNKIIRAKKLSREEKIAEIVESGLLSQALAVEIMTPDCMGGIGFASYRLSNNNAEIRRTRKRIEELTRLRTSNPIDFASDDFSIAIDNGRVRVEFTGGKPSEDTRTLLKSSGFKWSRYQGAWVRKATANGVAAARVLLDELKSIENVY